jgi:CDP-diglyceride synthetase
VTRHRLLAAALLVLVVVHNNAYKMAEHATQGHTWNLTGHVLISAMLLWIAYTHRSTLVTIVCSLGLAYSLQVVLCAIWWFVERWPNCAECWTCSDSLAIPLGMFGLVAACFVAAQFGGKRDE